jgi:filamin
VAIDGPSKAEVTCHDNKDKDGTLTIIYVAESAGEYRVAVRFADRHIKGSPFTVKITGAKGKTSRHPAIIPRQSNDSVLKISEADVKNLVASIVTPGGTDESCLVKKLPTGALGVSFTPRDSGQHFVNVRRGHKHVQGSPFMINVLDREIGDATKVKLRGLAIREAVANLDNEITVDMKEAGYGGLSISLEGPSKADITCKDNRDGTLTVNYVPTEPGTYVLYAKFAENHVPGSPTTIKTRKSLNE